MTATHKKLARWLGVVLAATVLSAGLARTEWLRSLEDFYYDYWHVLKGKRYEPTHTAFITVDDATLLAFKDDPLAFWAPYWGQAIDVLTQAGVKAVGLDFIYMVSAESWLKKLNLPDSQISREYDTPFRAALSKGKAILITHLVELPDGNLDLLMPPDDQRLLLPGGNNDLGIANLHPDADKHVRGFYPVMIPDPRVPGIAFNMQLALRAAGADPNASQWTIGGVEVKRELRRYPIGYAGPPGTIPTVSMLTLLQPDALDKPEVKALRGKVAIIAANNSGTSDRHFTPYSRGANADQMAGGEIHANIVETILSGRYPRPLPLWAELAYLGTLMALAAWVFLTLGVGVSAGIAVALLLAVVPPGYLAFQHDWVLPVAELQTALAAAFLMTLGLRLTGEERARSRMRQVFGRYVSDEVVNVLLAEDRKPDLAGESKEVTVLFSDIRGFTTISEKLSAHEVVEMLNAYFTRVCEPILAQGGTVDKYIGDAVMAVFGSPVTYPDHARRAVRAALGMAKEAQAFKAWMQERFPDKGIAEFGIGVGLFTGEAVIGDIGTPKRKEFTAIGDTVNAASRLEGVTKELKCVIAASESTVRAAGAGVKTGKAETLTVKGRSEPIRVHEVLAIEE
ncbi:MAG TPA: adenylate/guanylate cyclase domain-containing protein [Burkholderiales bacterium]|nr:adenylate/guanylate cyclase domain-containing protein [Burkholderiales bacterium]